MASSAGAGVTRSRGRLGATAGKEEASTNSSDAGSSNNCRQKTAEDKTVKSVSGRKERLKDADGKKSSRASSPAHSRQSSRSPARKEATPHTPENGSNKHGEEEGSDKEESPSSTKSSPPVEPLLANRPKRQVVPKNLDVASGLSWKEENDLKKALYASLQESRKCSRQQSDESGFEHDKEHVLLSGEGDRNNKVGRSRGNHKNNQSSDFRTKDESSQDSFKSALGDDSSQDAKNLFRARVHAQRKFAQGSRPCSPCTTPVKVKTTPRKLFAGKRAKTEDFLTFLCLRGSHVLPPHLDFFNMANDGNDNSSDSAHTPQHDSVPPSPKAKPPLENGSSTSPTPSGGSSHDDNELNNENDLGVAPLPADESSPKKISSKPDASVITKPIVTMATKSSPIPGFPEKCQRVSRSSPAVLLPGLAMTSIKQKPLVDDIRGISLKRIKAMNGKHATRATASNQHRDTSPSKDVRSKVKHKKSELLRKSSKSKRDAEIKKVSDMLKKRTKRLKERKDRTLRNLRHEKKRKNRNKKKLSERKEDKEMEVTAPTTRSRSAKREHESEDVAAQQSSPPKIKRLSSSSNDKGKQSPFCKTLRENRETRQSVVSSTSTSKSVSKNPETVNKPNIPAGAVKKSASYLPKSAPDMLKAMKIKSTAPSRVPSTTINTRHKPSPIVKLLLNQSAKKRSNKSKTQSNVSDSVVCRTKSGTSENKVDIVPRVAEDAASGSVSEQCKTEGSTASGNYGSQGECSGSSLSTSSNKPKKHNFGFESQFKKRGRPTGSLKKPVNAGIALKQPFPAEGEPARIVECPVYHPSPEQFQDPMAYIASVRSEAERYGMCRVVPPPEWKPECRVQEELRFSSQIQHLHKMQDRWGPNVQQMECLRCHLDSQGIKMDHPPTIGGVEVDLPRFYHTVQSLGGMQTVIDKKKWPKVADVLSIPKTAQERFGKLYDAYCKYLLSYDLLSEEEKERLETQVIQDHEKHKGASDGSDHCVFKGKSMSLSMFFRTARNIMTMWLKEGEPSADEVETEFWKILSQRTKHVAVQAGHIDTKNIGGGFPTKKDSPYSRHGWNFNMLSSNGGSVLKYLGAPVSGVNLPMLHVGMLFSTACWACDRHFLPYLQYCHSGADIIWYSIPCSQVNKLKLAMQSLVPDLLNETPVWLPEDSVMVPPSLLQEKGVSLSRCVQKQGQFIVVFSEVYTATISTGYNLSESLHVAPPDWISQGCAAAKLLHESCEPELFSMDRLICTLARNDKTPVSILSSLLPHLEDLVNNELELRKQVINLGMKNMEEMSIIDDVVSSPGSKRKKSQDSTEETGNICENSKKICYLSMVINETEDTVLSLQQAIQLLQKKKNLKPYKFMYRFDEKTLKDMVCKVKNKLQDHTDKQAVKSKS